MRSNADTEWTAKLQPAVLSANTQKKRSTGYTPFYLMFGRDYDSSNLLNLITSSSNNDDRSEPNEDGCTSDPGCPQRDAIPMAIDEADPYELPNNDDEWMQEIDETRDTDRMFAIDNIKKEQKIQKRNFDRKLKRNR